MSLTNQSGWWPNLRLLALLLLVTTSAGCGMLSREPVVEVKYVDRECPKPPALNLPEPHPSGYFRNRILEAVSP